jgi:rhombotail lipoprotein
MKIFRTLLCAVALLLLAGCASMFAPRSVHQAGSVVDYLYPDAREAPNLQPSVTRLRLPVRVGIAFVPGGAASGPSDLERQQLLERVKGAFTQYDFIGSIEVIPSTYLRPRGGFDNLDQAARMFNVDVMVLVSYDQIRFNDVNRLAVLYWTVVGAYIIKGDRYDVETLLDAAVFDVHSRKLLFRAPGASQVKGSSTLAGYSRDVRDAQNGGYGQAVEQLIPNLQTQLAGFRERVKSDPGIQIERSSGGAGGHGGAGGLGWPLALLMVGVAGWIGRRRAV